MLKIAYRIFRQNPLKRFFRFGFIGIASNLAGYIIYLIMTYIGVSPKVAVSIIYFICATISFWGNRKLTFKDKGNLFGSGLRFVITHSVGYLINFSILVVMVDIFGYAHYLVQAFAIVVVALFLYLAFHYFVFVNKADEYAKT
jgi:putative flippase GtrA